MLALIDKLIPERGHEHYRCSYESGTPEFIIFKLLRSSLSIFLSLSADDTDSLGTSTKLSDYEDHGKDSIDLHQFILTVIEIFGLKIGNESFCVRNSEHCYLIKEGVSLDNTTIGDIVEEVTKLNKEY